MLASTAALIAALVTTTPAVGQEKTQAPAQTGSPRSSETVDVTRGTRLVLNNFAGEVVVRTWDKDAVRVDARHSRSTKVEVLKKTEAQLDIRARSSLGALGSVDYELTVPAWMALRLTGTYLYVQAEGIQGELVAETVRGDVQVRGGSGTVSLKSIEGTVNIEGAKGRIEARSADGDITASDCSGELTVQTTDGEITLTRINAAVVDASTVDGDVIYDGSIAPQGQYRFTTHDGDVYLRIPENTSATVSVRTYEGSVQSNLAAQIPQDYRRGKRVTFTLGKGGAELEIESFEGRIRLLRPADPLPQKPKQKEQNQD